MAEIKDNDLRGFVKWYRHHFSKREDAVSVFVTCLCGRFHSHPRAMKDVMKRLVAIGLITATKEKITIL